jgi:hypothetical protein
MPAQSQQQQKLFGLALAFKRGEVPASEVSDEIKDIADRMSEKEIEDFASTKHKGLPKMKEQLRKIVREIMREKVISEMNEDENPCWKGYEMVGMKMKNGKEVPNCVPKNESVNEAASRTAMEIGGLTGMNKDAIQKFVDDNNLDIEKVFQFVKKGKLKDRMELVSAIAGKPNNPVQKKMIKMFSESVNEGASTEEKRIVMMAVKKIAKYRNVPLNYAVGDVIRAGQELERDIKKGKIK